MITDRLIVCIASSWDYDPTSKHHIMRHLARDNDVLWVNYHGSRRPTATAVDLRDSVRAIRRITRGLTRVSDSIYQLTPLVIPGATGHLSSAIHRSILARQIRRAVRAVRGRTRRPVQVWSFAPDVPYLVGALDEECFVYYCVDEYAEFDGYDAAHIATAERRLLRKADVVITSSERLWQTKRTVRPDAALVRHGVDFDHFANAWRRTLPRPHDLAAVPRPILGYFGLIHHWVDLRLLERVARRRQLYSFVIIGDCKVDVSRLARRHNVHLLGRKAFADLPAYCAFFDAALMLFARNKMAPNINPIKMHEYLAAGLPVISTDIPEARRYDGPITIARTPRQFAQACDRVLFPLIPHNRAAIARTVENEDWKAKVEDLSEIVMAHVQRRTRRVSKPITDILPGRAPAPEAVLTAQ